MRQFIGIGALWTTLVVVVWRGVSELLIRRRELERDGVLAKRIAERRSARIEHALVRVRVHASVHVGHVGASDLDDVGLLEAAMRRAARRAAPPLELGEVRVAAIDHLVVPGDEPALRWWTVALGALGVALTITPLVRPLDPSAPWLAIAGVACAGAAWLAARRR